ncbi:DNA polymerase/3'-5' exonuclease PolX [Bacillus piscicola]|uniref:DNA polymerase/3'-5' exonuclease PolX n=1 Tax=Bacillus piscicola TaxID=1632684 RepID=UPI0023DDBB62|nr:DNA polymerase/3'-5' exonuclease PolX [Bacillus piscicola]
MNKKELVKELETIALYMEIQGSNPFKISAYRKAAQALEKDERPLSEISNPEELAGIGKGTAAVIEELRETGKSAQLEKLKEEVPPGLVPLIKLPGLGGKKIAKLYQELAISDTESLRKACKEKKVRQLAGFGAKTEENIAAALDEAGTRPERLPITFMLETAQILELELDKITDIRRYARAGSLRRLEETIKDLDYIIETSRIDVVRERLKEIELVSDIIADGAAKMSLEMDAGYAIQVDFRFVSEEAFATTLHHFTGSKEHNVQIRQLAKQQGEKVSEYGIEHAETGEMKTFRSEAAFFAHFGLHYIPPEARLGKDEIECYKEPYDTITLQDIRGDLHMHTTWSDGAESVEGMVNAARKRGYEWMAITDHSQFLQVAHGLNEERVMRQIEEIRRVNDKYADIHVLAGIEMDIRPDGTLDLEDHVLKELDLVIASIHSAFSQSETELMKRMETALESTYVNIIAHPTGRLIGRRRGYQIDVEKLLERAGQTGTALELNANPNRLDLAADWLRKAEDYDTKIAINTDAHQTGNLDMMEIGTGIARKALLQKQQVINTWTYPELTAFINKKRRNS